MSTEIKLWSVTNGRLNPLQNRRFSEARKEKDLENWIARDPSLLGRPALTVLGQQILIADVGFLDLVASDGESRLIVVEFKRQQTTRDTIAQILDYASALQGMSREQLRNLFNPPDDVVLFQGQDPIEIQMIVVAADADESVERITSYLASKGGLAIEVVTFTYTALEDGREIIARSILVPRDVNGTSESHEHTKLSDLLRTAAARGVSSLVEILRKVRDLDWQEHPVSSYGGSLRYPIAFPPDNGARVLFGMNIAGRKFNSPAGALDVWVRPEIAAAYSETSNESVLKELEDFPALKNGFDGYFIRLNDAAAAAKLFKLLEKWDLTSAEYRAKHEVKEMGPSGSNTNGS